MNINLFVYLRTLKYLKVSQIFYYAFYWFRRRTQIRPARSFNTFGRATPLVLEDRPFTLEDSVDENAMRFSFLNRSIMFVDGVDWNYSAQGKLWAYHLNYFEFLHQKNLSDAFGLRLIKNYQQNAKQLRVGIEPYCISLRNLNLIYFLSKNRYADTDLDELIGQHYSILLRNLEYHLQANHLLENACSLLVGACYFRNEKLFARASRFLSEQLQEQIFSDGGHYERCPMYHLILLGRLLDLVNVLKSNQLFQNQDEVYQLLQQKAGLMVRWAQNMSCNEWLPAFHDSTNSGKVKVSLLKHYALKLGIAIPEAPLGDSYYRRFETHDLCLLMDVGSASPPYQPGHYHAGIFNFVLYANGIPCVVDTGVSTYENSDRRHAERSTMAHNTLSINGKSQSEVWSAFRVGRRARITILEDHQERLQAKHDGYRNMGKDHQVTLFTRGAFIVMLHEVLDVDKNSNPTTNELRLHFHPSVTPVLTLSGVRLEGFCILELEGASFVLEDYYFADDFNVTRKAKVLIISVMHSCKLSISPL